MPAKRTSTRRRPDTKRTGGARVAKGARPSVTLAVARWAAGRSVPRTGAELLTLVLVVLALVTFGGAIVAAIRHHSLPTNLLIWAGVLLLLAAVARLAPHWRSRLESLTPRLARMYAGATLLLIGAVSLSWHLLAETLGFAGTYLLMGPLSRPPAADVVLAIAGIVGAALVLGIPVGGWCRSLFGGAENTVRRLAEPTTVEARSGQALIEIAPAEASAATTAADPLPPTTSQPETVPPPPGDRPALPPIDVFTEPVKGPAARIDLEHMAQRIQETLASFNVSARVVGYHCGPVITQFDVQPDRGVKVKAITALHNDLALALAAPTIRIQAPVPGKPVVGIEVPNSSATVVTIRELLDSDAYRGAGSPLRVPLGKDVSGKPGVIDLAKMPHLLIAGATGSGKSACVNALVSSLLFQNTPDQMRLMMVDPKMVELAVYNGVPHLLSPVVTDKEKVVGVLQWALREMERRYELFAETTSRNITGFNDKAENLGLKRLPYIVLVIDELADLMMVAPEDVEDAICRIAQLARAAGIHLVIATQRPSVDVVTGLIKANFPARIAFAMTSQVDSRTILDTVGAEKLLGRGDMLYQAPDAPKPVRLQGAFVSDQEIERLVDFWQRSPLQEAVQRVAEQEFVAAAKAASSEVDEMLTEAMRVVREYQHASVSLLQRRLKIGYARAARVMDQLEAQGVVGPADGSRQRAVLDERETA